MGTLDPSQLLDGCSRGTCPKCGVALVLLPWAVEGVACETCADAEEAKQRAAFASASASAALAASGVPARLLQGWGRKRWTLKFGGWPTDVDAWSEDQCLQTFYGGPGSGKSGAAAIVLHESAMIGKSIRWMTFDAMIDLDREAMRGGPSLLQALLPVDVLVLDDLGRSQAPTAWEVERVARMIGARFDECRRTIVTTNISFEKFATLSGPLASRINSGLQVWFGKADRR